MGDQATAQQNNKRVLDFWELLYMNAPQQRFWEKTKLQFAE